MLNGRGFKSIFKNIDKGTDNTNNDGNNSDLKMSDDGEEQENSIKHSVMEQKYKSQHRNMHKSVFISCKHSPIQRQKQCKAKISFPKLENVQKITPTIDRVLATINVMDGNVTINDGNRSSWHKVQNVNTSLSVLSSNSLSDDEHDKTMESEIAWSSSSSPSDDDIEDKTSQIIDKPSSSSSQIFTQPTELDLLIKLIENEKNSNKNVKISKEEKKKKRCRPGGYVDLYRRTLKAAIANRKFLDDDKKLQHKRGMQLNVIDLKESFSVVLAIVIDEYGSKFGVIIDDDLVSKVKINSQLEAFYDVNIKPLNIEIDGENISIYAQPYKLLVL